MSPRRSVLLALAVAFLPSAIAGQAVVVRVDTVSSSSLLPHLVIVRRDSTPPCYDCGQVRTALIEYHGREIRLDSLQDVPRLWAILPPLEDSAGPRALSNRLMTIIEATRLLGRHPALVTGRKELDELARVMTKDLPIRPPQESAGGGVRATFFFVTTVDGLYRLSARLQSDNRLTIDSKFIRCYLCP